MRNTLLLTLTALLLGGCAHKRILQEGHGEAFETSLALQADRGRPTVADADYTITGFEGIELRLRVTEESTDEESGEIEAVEGFEVE